MMVTQQSPITLATSRQTAFLTPAAWPGSRWIIINCYDLLYHEQIHKQALLVILSQAYICDLSPCDCWGHWRFRIDKTASIATRCIQRIKIDERNDQMEYNLLLVTSARNRCHKCDVVRCPIRSTPNSWSSYLRNTPTKICYPPRTEVNLLLV